MSWNIVLNKVLEIKNLYIEKFGYADCAKPETGTCLEKWVYALKDEEYEKFLKPVTVRQYGSLVLLCYKNFNKINKIYGFNPRTLWDMFDGIYRECRGVVIDIEKEVLVLAPFRKFFNIDEREETKYELAAEKIRAAECVEFSEKMDGSMESARWYNNELVMASSSSVDPAASWRLEDGYKRIRESKNHLNMIKAYPDYTFIFEYITLQDAHIVRYTADMENLYLVGIRSTVTGEELPYKQVVQTAEKYGVPHAKMYYDKNLDEILSELDDKASYEAEGFVLFADGFRIKIKYNDYVKIHKSLGAIQSAKYIIRVMSEGGFDDYISKVPPVYRDEVNEKVETVNKYISKASEITEKYYNQAPKTDKKTYMVWINENAPKNVQHFCRRMYYEPEADIDYLTNNSKSNPSYVDMEQILNFLECYEEPNQNINTETEK